MNKKKNDILMILILVIAAAALFSFQHLSKSKGSKTSIVISFNNETILKGRIYEDAGKIIKNADYIDSKYISVKDNKLIIKNDSDYNILAADKADDKVIGIRCVESNCRDHVCMDVGLTSSEENPIICLPHRLAVRVIRTE